MRLLEALGERVQEKNSLIAFVGGGGKTSGILCLAKELSQSGKQVLIGTTTAMYPPKPGLLGVEILNVGITAEGKLQSADEDMIHKQLQSGKYHAILLEADGSKGRAIKGPAQWEPVIPEMTQLVIGVIGMDALGLPITEANVHRPEILAGITQQKLGESVDKTTILQLVKSPLGLFFHTPPNAGKVLLLNKVNERNREAAIEIAMELLLESGEGMAEQVLLASVQEQDPIYASYERNKR